MIENSYTMAELAQLYEKEAKVQGVDPQTAVAIFVAENSDKGALVPNRRISTKTTSRMGATGVGQVMPAQAQGLIKQGYLPKDIDLSSVEGQVKASVAAIKELQDRHGPDPLRIAVGYNANWKSNKLFDATGQLPAETIKYIHKVGSFLKIDAKTWWQNKTQKKAAVIDGAPMTSPLLDEAASSFANASKAGDDLISLMKQALNMHQDIIGEEIDQNTQIAGALDRMAKGAQTVSQVNAEAENKQDANKRAKTQFFGLNTDSEDSRVSRYNKQLAVADQLLSAVLPEIAKVQDINPATDPMGWLVGQFKLRALSPKMDTALKMKQAALSSISQLQQITKDQISLEPAYLEDQRQRLIEASVDRENAQLTIKKAELDERLRTKRLNTLAHEITLGKTTLEVARWEADRIVNEQHRQEAAEERKLRVQQFNEDRADRKAAREEVTAAKEKQRQDEEAELGIYRIGAAQFGIEPPNTLSAVKMMPPAMQQILRGTGSTLRYGNSLGDSVNNILAVKALGSVVKNNPVLEGFLRRVDVLSKTAEQEALRKPGAADQWKKMKPEERRAAAVDLVADKWKTELATTSVDRLSADNPFGVDAVAYAQAPGLTDNHFAKYVQNRRASDAQADINVKDIVKYGVDEIKAGRPAKKVLDDLHTFLTAGHRHRQELLSLSALNIGSVIKSGVDMTKRLEIDSNEWYGSVGSFQFGSQQRPTDLLNKAELQYLILMLAAKPVGQPTENPLPLSPFNVSP